MIEKIQLEITTRCNLKCEYCLKPQNTAEIDEGVVSSINGIAKKFILYGYGEPLLHEKVVEFASFLDGELVLSTNGMVDEKFEEIAELFDVVGISLDLNDSFRRGMELERVMKKLESLKCKTFAEVVLTSENIQEFPIFAEKIAEKGVDIMVTNLIAPNIELYTKALYFEGSRKHADFLHVDEDFVLKILRARKPEAERGFNLPLNLCALLEAKDRIRTAKKSEKMLEKAEDVARSYGIRLLKPEFFGEAENRECPYRDSLFVRADGFASPCMPLAYSHEEFLNRRRQKVQNFILGHLSEGIDELVEKEIDFERLRKSMDFPWCGDCGLVAGCWYLENGMDCYANKPSCSQCLYSVRIARCLI